MVVAFYQEYQILWAFVATCACLTFASGAGRAERLALGFLVSSSETEPMPAALQTFDKMPVASSPRFCIASVCQQACNSCRSKASLNALRTYFTAVAAVAYIAAAWARPLC